MKRRSFLVGAGAALLSGTLATPAVEAAAIAASDVMAGAEKYLGVPYYRR